MSPHSEVKLTLASLVRGGGAHGTTGGGEGVSGSSEVGGVTGEPWVVVQPVDQQQVVDQPQRTGGEEEGGRGVQRQDVNGVALLRRNREE